MRSVRFRFRASLLVVCVLFVTGCFPGMFSQQQQKLKTDPAFSPDGTKIAFVATHDGDAEIYVMNIDGTGLKRLTDNEHVDAVPTWSPDGRRIVFVSDRTGTLELHMMNADGTGQVHLATPIEDL